MDVRMCECKQKFIQFYIQALPNSLLDNFASIVGAKNLSVAEAVLDHHSHDESYHK